MTTTSCSSCPPRRALVVLQGARVRGGDRARALLLRLHRLGGPAGVGRPSATRSAPRSWRWTLLDFFMPSPRSGARRRQSGLPDSAPCSSTSPTTPKGEHASALRVGRRLASPCLALLVGAVDRDLHEGLHGPDDGDDQGRRRRAAAGQVRRRTPARRPRRARSRDHQRRRRRRSIKVALGARVRRRPSPRTSASRSCPRRCSARSTSRSRTRPTPPRSRSATGT